MPKNKVASPQPADGRVASLWTSFLKHGDWLFPLALFLTLRLFSADSYYLLSGDQCTFLEMARTFPKHQLYNQELYLIHPPMFGYAIGLLHLVLPLFASGLITVLLFACLNFFLLRKLALFEGIPKTAVFVGLMYLAISRPAVAYDSHIARVSILVFLTTLALLSFLRFLQEPGSRTLRVAIVANVLCLLVSDNALLLFPCEAILFLFRGSRRELKSIALPSLCVEYGLLSRGCCPLTIGRKMAFENVLLCVTTGRQ